MPDFASEVQTIVRLIDQRLELLRATVREFPPEKIWTRPQPGMASLGNLVCHVAGSMRDWLENGYAQGQWPRQRQAEFDRDNGWSGEQLIAHLDEVRSHCQQFFDAMAGDDPDAKRRFRDKTFAVRQMLLKQLDHVAYHAGQASFLRRLVAGLPPRP